MHYRELFFKASEKANDAMLFEKTSREDLYKVKALLEHETERLEAEVRRVEDLKDAELMKLEREKQEALADKRDAYSKSIQESNRIRVLQERLKIVTAVAIFALFFLAALSVLSLLQQQAFSLSLLLFSS